MSESAEAVAPEAPPPPTPVPPRRRRGRPRNPAAEGVTLSEGVVSFSRGARARRKGPRPLLYGMDKGGNFAYNDLKNLPPLEVDQDGFAIPPAAIGLHRRRNMTLAERKIRYVLMWNYTGGNHTLACQEAGVMVGMPKRWLKDDPDFMEALRQQSDQIADRLHFRLMVRVGLVPPSKNAPKGGEEATLRALLKKIKPDVFETIPEDPGEQSTAAPEPDVPRPAG